MKKLINDLKEEGYSEIYQYSFLKEFCDAFDDYLKQIKVVKYLILGENPLSWETYVNNPEGKLGYINPINNAFEFNCTSENRLDEWAKKGIMFLDIYQLFDFKSGFDLNKKMKKVSYRETLMKSKINIEGEELNYPVFRLKIAISYLEEKLKCNNLKVADDLKVALMIPQLTSLPIFNYFSELKNTILLCDVEFSSSLRQINSNPSYLGSMENIIIPRHKANTIGGSNNPKSELIKLALDL